MRCRPPFLTATYSLLSNRWTLQSVEILFVRGGGVWGKMLLKGLVRFKIQVSSSYQVLVGASITYLYSPREALGYSSYILSSPLFQFPFSPRAVGGAALSVAPQWHVPAEAEGTLLGCLFSCMSLLCRVKQSSRGLSKENWGWKEKRFVCSNHYI